MTTGASLTSRPAFKALQAHYQQMKGVHLRELFAQDPKRGERYVVSGAGLTLDYSKNRLNDETLKLLVALAEDAGVAARR